MEYDKVNKPIKRVDAYEKVTGKAKFGADLFFPNMLYGKVLRSKYPHARIVKVNIKKALSMVLLSCSSLIVKSIIVFFSFIFSR